MYKIIGVDRLEYGPVDADQINQWIREGRANEQTLVQEAGTNLWKPITEIPKFAAVLNARPKPPPVTPQPAVPSRGTTIPIHVPNYLLWSILTTLLCCPPVGIPAIYYSLQVDKRVNAGDVDGARAASEKARLWCWISVVAGVLFELVMWWGVQWLLKGNLAERMKF